jgi:hypothetical protein
MSSLNMVKVKLLPALLTGRPAFRGGDRWTSTSPGLRLTFVGRSSPRLPAGVGPPGRLQTTAMYRRRGSDFSDNDNSKLRRRREEFIRWERR